ncbi:hypothetical protein D3C86_2175160 [compost metagenome]
MPANTLKLQILRIFQMQKQNWNKIVNSVCDKQLLSGEEVYLNSKIYNNNKSVLNIIKLKMLYFCALN